MLTCDFPGGSTDPLSPSLDPPMMAILRICPPLFAGFIGRMCPALIGEMSKNKRLL